MQNAANQNWLAALGEAIYNKGARKMITSRMYNTRIVPVEVQNPANGFTTGAPHAGAHGSM